MKKRILCAALALLLAAGCGLNNNNAPALSSGQEPSGAENKGTELPRPDTGGGRIYSIPLGDIWFSGENWHIDKDGNEVIPNGQTASGYTEHDLTDLATGETRYRYRIREETVRDEQDYPQTRRLCALYDLEGNRLLDWEEKSYRSAFGDYIIRQESTLGMVSSDDITDSFRTALYHVPTGTESYEGTFEVANLGGGYFLLLGSQHTTLGIIDSEGGAVSEFPMSKPYYSAYMWNGHLTASSMHPNARTKDGNIEYFLEFKDGNLQETFSAEWLSDLYGALRGDYIAYRNGSDWGVYQPDKGVVFESEGASVEYYDGELAIVQTGSYRGYEPINAALVTAGHEELAGGFSWLIPAQPYIYDDRKEPAGKFIGILGDEAVLIDRAGEVLASSPVLSGAVSLTVLCDGLYTYYFEDGPVYGTGLLGPNLEVLVSADAYTWINLGTGFYSDNSEWDGRAETVLLEKSKEIGNRDVPDRNIYRTDILDHTGRVIVDNVTLIYDIGPDRIALKRGFDIGLMDWNGNWVVKRRAFTGFGND